MKTAMRGRKSLDTGKITEWIRGLRSGEKLPKKNHLLLILAAGILLLVVTFPDPTQKSASSDEEQEQASGQAGNADLQKYADDLEKRTAGLLSQVEGAGEVSVMITLKSGNRKIIEKDQADASQSVSEESSDGVKRTTEDRTEEETSIYRQNSDGSSEPYVSSELYPEIEGVVVIADGGSDAVVRQEISEAVQALFDVAAHKIKIMKHA